MERPSDDRSRGVDHPDYFAHSRDAGVSGDNPLLGPDFSPPGERPIHPEGAGCDSRQPLEHSRKIGMGRRTVLLIVAALVAVLGTGMVFLYVRGADDRAEAGQAPVQVLKAVAQIEPGETLAAAQAAGKIELGKVPRAQALDGAVNSVTGLENSVALTTIYPNEQIVTAEVRRPRRPGRPQHPGRQHRDLREPVGHRTRRGLREPGCQRGDLPQHHPGRTAARPRPGCCSPRSR